MIGSNKILVFLLVLFFCSGVFAGLLVNVSPKDPGFETMVLYPDETGDYEITVFNIGEEPVLGVQLKATVSDGLKIIDAGVEKTVLAIDVGSLGANEKESFLVKLKPSELSTKNLFIYVDYGVGDYTHLAATFLSVAESPLHVDAQLSKTALDMGDKGSISLSFRNNGSEPINNIVAELIVFPGLESVNGTVSFASLAPGEGYEAKEFVFRADPDATGKKPLVMQVSFEDSRGKHVLERNFFVEIQSKQTIVYLIVAIIILLVFVAIISRKSDSKSIQKLEKPIVQELEGEKAK